jgi:hypothetical protein
MTLNVEEEVKQLVEEIKRLGAKGPDGKTAVRHVLCSKMREHPMQQIERNYTSKLGAPVSVTSRAH